MKYISVIRMLAILAIPVALGTEASFSAQEVQKEKAAKQAITCASLGEIVARMNAYQSATSAIVPATDQVPQYCALEVRTGVAINISVGLPLSRADAENGALWNGRVQNIGGGGYNGVIDKKAIEAAVSLGYVASSTDSGHNPEWCNAINPATGKPNAQPDCGNAGGGFMLDPDQNLIDSQIADFTGEGVLAQTNLALVATKAYYGDGAAYNYWVGCSQGGREGLELAQKHAELFDGFLVGAPAVSFNRISGATLWGPVNAYERLGALGLAPAKSEAANAAAVKSCDPDDGVVDGIIDDPRSCMFNANELLCKGDGSDTSTCLTSAEAETINTIWDGPRLANGKRLWGGIPRGATFERQLPGGNSAGANFISFHSHWVHQDPVWDYKNSVTIASFPTELDLSYYKFEDRISSDSPDLDGVIKRGAKIMHYHGTADPSSVSPFTSYNYVGKVYDRYGMKNAQDFMRSFFYPGVAHCSGGSAPQPDTTQLLKTLENWVEKGVAPEHVVASQSLADGAVRTRKICKYPDKGVYSGQGSSDDEVNFVCETMDNVPVKFAEDARSTHD